MVANLYIKFKSKRTKHKNQVTKLFNAWCKRLLLQSERLVLKANICQNKNKQLYMKRLLISLCVISLVFGACKSKKEDEDNHNESINECIYDIMDIYYLWNNHMPKRRNVDFNQSPDKFFESLLYKPDEVDLWSYISDDSQALDDRHEGTPYSMGYAPQFALYDEGKYVAIIVLHVYPNTPAARAGLKRGDLILDINNTPLTPDNYVELYTLQTSTYGLGFYDPVNNYLDLTGVKVEMSAEKIEADPSAFDTIYYVGSKPVGYYAYMSFTTGNKFHPSMDAAFDRFKAAGVKDLILDLRYNGGGDIETAGHLASAIAPVSVVNSHEVLVTFVYNNLLTNAYKGYEEESIYRFPNNSHNADIENLYVLGTYGTASASELVTIGLKPYMNVTLVGENTYGKYTGMIVFDKKEKDCQDLENWAIAPIVMKYANAEGFTDFKDGLIPDIYVEDDVLSGYSLGCPDDPMIAAALDRIEGLPLTAKAARRSPLKHFRADRSVEDKDLIINKLRINN